MKQALGGYSACLQVTADEHNLWELYYLGNSFLLYLFASTSLEPSTALFWLWRKKGWAHPVLKLWKHGVSVLDSTPAFWGFCHRPKPTLQIKITLGKKGSNLTHQNARKGPLAVSQRLRDIPAPLTVEGVWSSRDAFQVCTFSAVNLWIGMTDSNLFVLWIWSANLSVNSGDNTEHGSLMWPHQPKGALFYRRFLCVLNQMQTSLIFLKALLRLMVTVNFPPCNSRNRAAEVFLSQLQRAKTNPSVDASSQILQ